MIAPGTPRRTRRLLGLVCAASLVLTPGCSPEKEEKETGSGFQRYVALGDSYTSAPLVPEPVRARGCHRSTGNYPSLAADLLDVKVVDRSCSSASTEALTESQLSGVPAQLDAVNRATDLVTVSIGGGNGKLFPKLVGGCSSVTHLDPTGTPCKEAVRKNGDELLTLVEQTGRDVEQVLEEIRDRAAPDARVLLVGYPSIFPATGSCSDRLPLADGDVAYAATVMAALDEEMRGAAQRTGVDFVDVYAATKGHDICGKDPWIQGQGNAEDAMAFHPLPREQQVVARLVVDRLR